jgi:basic amino acid/polyamine antiporter, APA family
MKRIFQKKCVHEALACAENDKTLKRSIGPLGLTIMGVGGIIGAGIFIITGVASSASGPALMLSFIVAAIACTFTALCYAEFASMIPIAGSVYTYTYITMGEIWAWLMGWIMVLQYLIASAAVAIGWSSYAVALVTSTGIILPAVISGPLGVNGSIINLPAVIIILILTGVLVRGAQESARFNAFIVFIKIVVILLFITIGVNYINPSNYHPFTPYGLTGVFQGAAMVFFAYLGFDAVASAAEETKDPGRTIPIGIIGSLIISSILYVAVAAVMTGMVPYNLLNNASPVAFALQFVGVQWAFTVITIGAIAGLTTVVLVNMFSKARIIFAMSRDGLLPKVFSKVDKDCKAPVASIVLVGAMATIIAAFFSLDSIFELVNVGALSAFIFLALSVIILRRQQPEMKRSFKCPLVPAIPILSIIFSLALISQLKIHILQIFIVWLVLGVIVYFAYGKYRGQFKDRDDEDLVDGDIEGFEPPIESPLSK